MAVNPDLYYYGIVRMIIQSENDSCNSCCVRENLSSNGNCTDEDMFVLYLHLPITVSVVINVVKLVNCTSW